MSGWYGMHTIIGAVCVEVWTHNGVTKLVSSVFSPGREPKLSQATSKQEDHCCCFGISKAFSGLAKMIVYKSRPTHFGIAKNAGTVKKNKVVEHTTDGLHTPSTAIHERWYQFDTCKLLVSMGNPARFCVNMGCKKKYLLGY